MHDSEFFEYGKVRDYCSPRYECVESIDIGKSTLIILTRICKPPRKRDGECRTRYYLGTANTLLLCSICGDCKCDARLCRGDTWTEKRYDTFYIGRDANAAKKKFFEYVLGMTGVRRPVYML